MKVSLGNISLYYKKTGQGQPLLMLHGNGENHQIFDPLAKRMSQYYTVYQIDSRNHGKSTQTTNFHYQTMAEDVAAFIRKLQLKNVSLLGFSDGAIIGILLSLSAAIPLKKLVLLGINLTPQDLKPEIYQSIVAEYETTQSPMLKLMLTEPNIKFSELDAVHQPTLVIAGENDICSTQYFEKIAQSLPDGDVLIISGEDHGSYIVDNDRLAPDLLKFLAD